MREVYVLSLKFSSEKINRILEQWPGSLPDGRDARIAQSVGPDTIGIITRIVQPIRLLRELRILHLQRPVTIYSVSFSSIEADLTSYSLHAWSTYSPVQGASSSASSDERRLSVIDAGLEALLDRVRGGFAASDLHKVDTRNFDSVERQREDDLEDVVPKWPRLLQHESTTDPSSLLSVESGTHPRRRNAKYACQRYAPLHCANESLAGQLQLMKLARTLQGDWIGERAYSSALASIRAVPEPIDSAADVASLEGCGKKIVDLIAEYLKTGKIKEVEETWASSDLNILLSFWNCHGVGAVTAREWFYNKGYRDLNDAIQDWDQHSRSIQIGLKHYDDFLQKIPREEVKTIGELVAAAANKVAAHAGSATPIDYEICGGYRRGKDESGDVDVLLTHETCHGFDSMLQPLLKELEKSNCLKHIINAHLERDASKQSGGGLSIALVVITFPGHNIHRRLDIIVCPPQTYITAITGWSGSTTLERDLRRYASEVKGLTFDSTGLSDPVTRTRVEDPSFIWTAGASTVDMEKALFSYLGLDYIPPKLRNAG